MGRYRNGGGIVAVDSETGNTAVAEVTAENGSSVSNGRSGYYIAGHDWPAIFDKMAIADIYAALRDIDDKQVSAAAKSMLTAGPPPDTK